MSIYLVHLVIAIGNVVRLWCSNLKDSKIGNYRIVVLNSNEALESKGCGPSRYGTNHKAEIAKGLDQVLSIRDHNENRLAT